MATQVVDPSTGAARFTISGGHVYAVGGSQPSYSISGDYWCDPATGAPKLWVQGGFVYSYPDVSTLKFRIA